MHMQKLYEAKQSVLAKGVLGWRLPAGVYSNNALMEYSDAEAQAQRDAILIAYMMRFEDV